MIIRCVKVIASNTTNTYSTTVATVATVNIILANTITINDTMLPILSWVKRCIGKYIPNGFVVLTVVKSIPHSLENECIIYMIYNVWCQGSSISHGSNDRQGGHEAVAVTRGRRWTDIFCLPLFGFLCAYHWVCTIYPQLFKLQANCGDDGHSCHFLLCLPSSVQGCSLILDIELQDTYYIGGWCHVWWCEDKF